VGELAEEGFRHLGAKVRHGGGEVKRGNLEVKTWDPLFTRHAKGRE